MKLCGLAQGILGTFRAVALLLILLTFVGCGSMSLFRGGTAKENAVQAIVTVTKAADALMTAAGIAYNAGAFGEPGSQRAEETWSRISAESVRMHDALIAWDGAIRANKDSTTFSFAVSQALAVIAALLPGGPRANLVLPESPVTWASMFTDYRSSIGRLASPDTFIQQAAFGGAR